MHSPVSNDRLQLEAYIYVVHSAKYYFQVALTDNTDCAASVNP